MKQHILGLKKNIFPHTVPWYSHLIDCLISDSFYLPKQEIKHKTINIAWNLM